MPATPGQPCDGPQQRRDGLVCSPSGFGPIWFDAPFARDNDAVVVLSGSVDISTTPQVGSMAVAMADFQEITSFGQEYWCALAGLINVGGDDEETYSMFEFSMLTPTGKLQNATIPLVSDLENTLRSGAVAPGGYASGAVCFDRPANDTGRFAFIYEPVSFLHDDRAAFYFDH